MYLQQGTRRYFAAKSLGLSTNLQTQFNFKQPFQMAAELPMLRA
jgi:hypothetical protein